jgi:hypothetical protein
MTLLLPDIQPLKRCTGTASSYPGCEEAEMPVHEFTALSLHPPGITTPQRSLSRCRLTLVACGLMRDPDSNVIRGQYHACATASIVGLAVASF